MTEEVEQPAWPKVRDTFYIIAAVNDDGSLDLNSEGKDGYALEAAIQSAVDLVRDHGGVQCVVECRAVRRVVDRDPCVQKLKPRR